MARAATEETQPPEPTRLAALEPQLSLAWQLPATSTVYFKVWDPSSLLLWRWEGEVGELGFSSEGEPHPCPASPGPLVLYCPYPEQAASPVRLLGDVQRTQLPVSGFH